jgi:phosphatidylglycerol lysyltransferase
MLASPQRKSLHALATAGRGALALLIATAALANVATTLLAHPWQPALFIEYFFDVDMLGWGREGTLIACALLVLVARALLRGKRHAWLITVALLAFSVLSVVVSRAHLSYTPVALALLVALLLLAPLFPNRSDPRSLRRGYLALGLSVSLFLSHGLLAQLWFTRSPLHVTVHVVGQLRATVLLLLRSLLFLFLGYGVFEVLRPVLTVRRQQRDERGRVQRIVGRYGAQTLAHFALGEDKTYFWSATGRAVIAYRLVHGVALILGDPIGPEDELEPLLLAFLTYCQRQDWCVAFYQTTGRTQQICRAWHLHAYKIGEEGIVEVAAFSTQGKAGAPVRHSIARARRDGITVRCWQGVPPPDAIFAGMKRVSAAWLGQHKTQSQMGFSMGRFPADWSPDLLTAVALDPRSEVQAFLTWTPLYSNSGWSLDTMRRLAEAAPGVMEMLIAESMEWARVRGHARMSIGLAPLAGLDTSLEADLRDATMSTATQASQQPSCSWLERSAAYLYRSKLLLGNYASLYHFKAKFHPTWEPRYLIVTDTGALPRVLLALMNAQGYTWWRMLRDTGASALPQLAALARRAGGDGQHRGHGGHGGHGGRRVDAERESGQAETREPVVAAGMLTPRR